MTTPYDTWLDGGSVLVVAPNHAAAQDAWDYWRRDAAVVRRSDRTLFSGFGGKAIFVVAPDVWPDQFCGLTLDACEGIALLDARSQHRVQLAMLKPNVQFSARQRLHLNQWAAVPEPELELTFGTEPIVGWRAWSVIRWQMRDDRTEPRLASLTGREVWQPRRRVEATCSPNREQHYYENAPSSAHEAPWPSCQCGIWTVRDRHAVDAFRAEQRGLMRAQIHCFGPVYLWGRVLEFAKGYRAQYAYPQQLYLLEGTDVRSRQLEELYGVPVENIADPALRTRVRERAEIEMFSVSFAEMKASWELMARLGRAASASRGLR